MQTVHLRSMSMSQGRMSCPYTQPSKVPEPSQLGMPNPAAAHCNTLVADN